MILEQIISGGQTGADQGALAAAKELGLKTGGWMPMHFRTETGPHPDLGQLYGMQEHSAWAYPPRTEANVSMSDGTLLIGDPLSNGSRLTRKLCADKSKPIFIVLQATFYNQLVLEHFRSWLGRHKIKVLNVAGNRESVAPGIHDVCKNFLLTALRK